MRIPLVIFFLLFTTKVIAPDVRTLVIEESEPVDIYERLMMAILQVESAGDTLAFNPLEDAYGPFQIRPIRLKDYNNRTGNKYTLKDCYTVKVSKEVFLYYARSIGPDYETIAKRWNGSGKKTIEYWDKVKIKLREQERGVLPMKLIFEIDDI